MFEYRGYIGVIDDADTETGWFAGSVFGIQDVVTFEGKTVPELQKAFRDSVDDYLEFCKELKHSPEKPFSGKFVLRLSPELHRLASEAARKEELSLNAWITGAVEGRLSETPKDAAAISFGEIENLADCVAAIIAAKERRNGTAVPDRKKKRRRTTRMKATSTK